MLARRSPRLEIRRTAGWVLLSIFVLAAQLAPVAHLATHRNDHTHGPELAPHADDDDADALTPAEAAWLAGGDWPPEPAPHSHGSPFDDHGHDSVAHFALATLQGPPPPLVPPPAETIAPPPNHTPRGHEAPALPQPPARGPPA